MHPWNCSDRSNFALNSQPLNNSCTEAQWAASNGWHLIRNPHSVSFELSTNERTMRDIEKDLQLSWRHMRPLLRIIAVWPNPKTTSWYSNVLKFCHIFLTYFLQLFVVIPVLLYAILQERNGRLQIQSMIPLINGLSQICKYTVLLYRIQEFKNALEEIRSDWLSSSNEGRSILSRKAKIGHKVLLIMAITAYGGGLSYRTILPLSKGTIFLPDNTTIRLLPCPSYFVFFSEQNTPRYEIIFALQILGGFVKYTTLCGTISICVTLCLHLSGMLRILNGKMETFTKQSDVSENAVQEKLVDIVLYQTRIRRFLKQTERITEYLYFCEIIDETLITCIVGYCIIVEWENSNALAIIIYLLLQITCISCTFTMCYVGQVLIDESTIVSWTSATLDWYRFPLKKARYLILVNIMSNYRIRLSAAGMVEISLATFTDIMKAAVGYLNVLRTVN